MEQKNNPLHGITLEQILTELVEKHGWEVLGEQINIRCFQDNPSIGSSLKFLRKTPWARAKVEALYLHGPVKVTRRKSAKPAAKSGPQTGLRSGPKPGSKPKAGPAADARPKPEPEES